MLNMSLFMVLVSGTCCYNKVETCIRRMGKIVSLQIQPDNPDILIDQVWFDACSPPDTTSHFQLTSEGIVNNLQVSCTTQLYIIVYPDFKYMS